MALPEKVKKPGAQEQGRGPQWWEAQKPETHAWGPTRYPRPRSMTCAPDIAIRYAARDADCTLRIYPALKAQVDAMGIGRSRGGRSRHRPDGRSDADGRVGRGPRSLPRPGGAARPPPAHAATQIDHWAGGPINATRGIRSPTFCSGGCACPPASAPRAASASRQRTRTLRRCGRTPDRAAHPRLARSEKLKATYVEPMPGFIRRTGGCTRASDHAHRDRPAVRRSPRARVPEALASSGSSSVWGFSQGQGTG